MVQMSAQPDRHRYRAVAVVGERQAEGAELEGDSVDVAAAHGDLPRRGRSEDGARYYSAKASAVLKPLEPTAP